MILAYQNGKLTNLVGTRKMKLPTKMKAIEI